MTDKTGFESDKSSAAPTPIAGFRKRAVAYFVDILPITFLVAAYYYFYLGFDKTLAMHFDGPAQTQHTRLEFLV
ncbi:MAG: hypothetical protein WBD20_17550, partial [Pirellulaceae bacterium]